MARMWDEITRWAEREGLGNAVRLHREYRGARWPWWAGGVTAVLLTPVPFFLREASFPFWQLLPLAWSVPIGAALLWQYLAPVRHRRWYAVASGGLLVYSPAGPIIAIPWKALRRTESGGLRQRVAGKSVPLEIPPVAGRSDLMLSLRSRRVVPSTLRWLPAWPQRGLVAVAVLWLIGFPLAVSAFENWRPSSLARLTDLCEDGDPFPGAPRYEGAGPHPMAVAGIVTEPVEVWAARAVPNRLRATCSWWGVCGPSGSPLRGNAGTTATSCRRSIRADTASTY